MIAARHIATLLSVLLAVAFLAACGDDGGGDTSAAPAAETQTAPTREPGTQAAESERHRKQGAEGQGKVEAPDRPAKGEKTPSSAPRNSPDAKQAHHPSRGSADGCPGQLNRHECDRLAATLATGEKSGGSEPESQPQKCPPNLSQGECASLGKTAAEGGSSGQDLPVQECPAGLSPAGCRELEEAASR